MPAKSPSCGKVFKQTKLDRRPVEDGHLNVWFATTFTRMQVKQMKPQMWRL